VDLATWSDWRGPDGTSIIAPYEQANPSMYPGVKPEKMEGDKFLFNLREDISEMTNSSVTHPDISAELEKEYLDFLDTFKE
jgi:hypothetical protein